MVLTFPACRAVAQAAAAAAPQPASAAQGAPPDPQTTVTVVAATPAYRETIDRRSYSLADDLQKATGSLSDVLRKVPSLQVDPDGNVSLRGDPDVTILVDGKPSSLFSGPGRTQALQSMSADQFERVEVMTNPPAGVTAAGSGGVINLITKKGPQHAAAPTASATVKANAGSNGRFDVGASGAYSAPGLALNSGGDFRRSGFLREIGSQFGLPGGTSAALVPATGVQDQNERDDELTVYASLGYDIDPKDHLDANLNLVSGRLVRTQESVYATRSDLGPTALTYDAPGFFHAHYTSKSEALGLTHSLPGDGQSVSVKVEVSQNNESFQNRATYAYAVPVQPSLYQDLGQNAAFPQVDVKVDYKTALPNKAKLTLGYEGTFDWQNLDDQGVQGVSAAQAQADVGYAQTFEFNQQINALYATYEQTFGRLTVQPGLRLESTSLTTDLSSGQETGMQRYFEAYPSLHLDYALDANADLKLSYGRRTQRPDETQLDPFRTESNATLYTQGNPDLHPSFTQSYEFGYEYRRTSTDFQATLFYRDKTDVLTTVTQDIGDDVLLSVWENLGYEHDEGLELVGAYAVFKGFSVNASTDLMQAQVSAANLGISGARSAFIASGKATLNWQVTAKDALQLESDASGRQLTAQGYRGGAIFSSLGWRHAFDQRLAAVLTGENPFGLARRTIDIDTPTLVEVDKRKFNDVTVFLGLTYLFGAAPKHADAFNFGSHGPGG